MNNQVYSNELYQMCVRHFNEPMISFGKVVRCIGYGETAIDCYILTRHPSEKYGELGEIHWHTCVGGYKFLTALHNQGYTLSSSGKIWDDLSRLESELDYQGCPKEKEFLLKLDHDNEERITDVEEFRIRMIEKFDKELKETQERLDLINRIRLTYVDRTASEFRSKEDLEEILSNLEEGTVK